MSCRRGSALLLILSVIFVLLAAMLKCWKISSFRIDIQAQREIYYRRFCLTDNLLNASVEQAIDKFDQIFKVDGPVKIDLASLVKTSKYSAYGQVSTVHIKKKIKPDTLAVEAFLLDGLDVVFSLKCLLSKKRMTGQTKQRFVISGYTIL
jgi:hypothetical protein